MWDKTKRAMDTMKERNRRYLEEQKKKDEAGREENPQPDPDSPKATTPEEPSSEDPTPEEKAAAFHEKEQLKLEKGDLPAMILSAFMVFGPVFLVLIAIMVLAWIFLH